MASSSSISGEPGREVGADFDAKVGTDSKEVDGAFEIGVDAPVGCKGVPQISHSIREGWFRKVHAGHGVELRRPALDGADGVKLLDRLGESLKWSCAGDGNGLNGAGV